MAKLILWILELFLFASLFTFNVTRQLEMEGTAIFITILSVK